MFANNVRCMMKTPVQSSCGVVKQSTSTENRKWLLVLPKLSNATVEKHCCLETNVRDDADIVGISAQGRSGGVRSHSLNC